MQAVLSPRIAGRKVRAAESAVLPNGKAPIESGTESATENIPPRRVRGKGEKVR